MKASDRLAVRWVLLLNRLTPELNAGTIRSKRSLRAYSDFEYNRAPSTVRLFGPYFDVAGKDVLDVGCGLGGSERFYLEQGARSVVAVDLSLPRLAAGKTYIGQMLAQDSPRLLFVEVDARRTAFPKAAFDVIVSTNTFEHIFGVDETLRECARILKPGGRLLIAFPPYHSPWGAHLGNWIRFPWCQVLFSERTLVAATKHVEAELRVNAWMPEAIRLDLDGHDQIPHLNRMTVHEFEKTAASGPLKIVYTGYNAMGWRSGGRLGKVGQALAQNEWLREYVTSQAVYVMEKPLL
jgi:SAM-dependent methyltransferase